MPQGSGVVWIAVAIVVQSVAERRGIPVQVPCGIPYSHVGCLLCTAEKRAGERCETAVSDVVKKSEGRANGQVDV